MSVTWFFLILEIYRNWKYFRCDIKYLGIFLHRNMRAKMPKNVSSFFLFSTSTYLWNNDRFLVEYIHTYHASASINFCVHVHWKAHTAQKVVLKLTWQGWLDEMMSFLAYLIQLTWWINDVWIRCHWRSVTFKIVLNIKIEVIKRVDGKMTHTAPFDWTAPPNIKTILTQWILIQIFFSSWHSILLLWDTWAQCKNETKCWMTSTGNFVVVFLSQHAFFRLKLHRLSKLVIDECDKHQIQWIYKSDKQDSTHFNSKNKLISYKRVENDWFEITQISSTQRYF